MCKTFGLLALLLLAPITSARAQSIALDPAPGTTDALIRLAAGVVPDGLSALEAALEQQLGRRSAERAITELGFRLRGTGPALVATADDPGLQLLVYTAARDSQGVRRAVAAVDAARRRLAVRNLPPPVALAEALLWLGDTSTALAHLREFERNEAQMDPTVSWGMVRNEWLVARAHALLAELLARRPARADTARYELRPRAGFGAARFRYDAVMWARLPTQPAADTGRVIARFTVHATERASVTDGGGLALRQTYGGIELDLPLRGLLGMDDLTLRRQIRDASRDLTALTVTDAAGQVVRRTVQASAPLPEELRGALEDGTGFLPLAAAVPIPARAVAVGESWRDSVRLWVPGGLFDANTRVPALYRLERVAEAGERTLAFISIAARGGEAMLTGELVLDVNSGEAIRLAASLRTPVARVLLTALREPAAGAITIALASDESVRRN